MPNDGVETPRWNVFAAVLEDQLLARGHKMTALYHAGIYRELVRRLRRSLVQQGTFPVLNPTELDRIALHFKLTPDEVWRLRAAVIATAAERLLYGRIPPQDALLVARQLLPVLDDAIRLKRVSRVWRHDNDEGRNPGESSAEEPLDLPEPLASASMPVLRNLDEGALALHLGAQSHPQHERVYWAHEAIRHFQAVQIQLASMTEDLRASAQWVEWQDEAHQGLSASVERLRALSGTEDVHLYQMPQENIG